MIEEDKLSRQYLLGALPPSEQQRFEQRLLTEAELFQELLLAEDDLIDDYVADNITPEERNRFDRHFLCTPERRQHLRFAEALRRQSAGAAAVEPPAFVEDSHRKGSRLKRLASFLSFNNPLLGYSLTAALMLLLLACAWLTVRVSKFQGQLSDMQATHASSQKEEQELRQELERQHELSLQLSNELERQKQERAGLEQTLASLTNQQKPATPTDGLQQKPKSSILAVFLSPGGVRGTGETSRVQLPAGVEWLQARLDLPAGDYSEYQAELQTAEGAEVFSAKGLKSKRAGGGSTVVVKLPASRLQSGDYRIKLRGVTRDHGIEDISSYPFRVSRK